MGHSRRRILWLGVTAHPTAEWLANQLTQAFGWERPLNYLIRDRDACYGNLFVRRVRSLGIRDRPTSPRSPWQNGYAERLSICRECLDHVVVFGERHLRHLLLFLRELLQLCSNPPIAGKGLSSCAPCACGRTHPTTARPRWVAPSIYPDLINGRDSRPYRHLRCRPARRCTAVPPAAAQQLRAAPNGRGVLRVQECLEQTFGRSGGKETAPMYEACLDRPPAARR